MREAHRQQAHGDGDSTSGVHDQPPRLMGRLDDVFTIDEGDSGAMLHPQTVEVPDLFAESSMSNGPPGCLHPSQAKAGTGLQNPTARRRRTPA
jgi:hypothetical protein